MTVKRKIRTEITRRTFERIIVPLPVKSMSIWCDGCRAAVEMFPPERAAQLLGLTPREVYRRVENGSLHFTETEDGTIFICCRVV